MIENKNETGAKSGTKYMITHDFKSQVWGGSLWIFGDSPAKARLFDTKAEAAAEVAAKYLNGSPIAIEISN